MMRFSIQEEILNDNTIHLAALAQTAVHGWHGMAVDEECTAKTIAEALGIDPEYMFKWYYENTYDVPEKVIQKIKDAAANGSIDNLLKINVTELCYPPKWLIAEFRK